VGGGVILGWRYATHLGRYVVVDTLFPWPALHHGRENLRLWVKAQKALRARGTEGPEYVGSGITTAVKEDGEAEMRVWPMAKGMMPRQWSPQDTVWREPLIELRRFVGRNLACTVRLNWMPGGDVIERVKTVPSLADRKGFWGWQRGEREPTEKMTRSIAREMGAQVAGFKPRTMTGFSAGAASWP
jgi:hypothetical protein